MKSTYKTEGVCATHIELDAENGVVKSVAFKKGCDGNAKGIAELVKGMAIGDAVKRLKGIKCGSRKTSCPDQLAIALEGLE